MVEKGEEYLIKDMLRRETCNVMPQYDFINEVPMITQFPINEDQVVESDVSGHRFVITISSSSSSSSIKQNERFVSFVSNCYPFIISRKW